MLDGNGFENYMNQRILNQIFQEITDPNRIGGPFDGSQIINSENYPEIIEEYPLSANHTNKYELAR